MTRLVVLTPSFRPVGGVVKIFDYVGHAVALGLDVEVHCPHPVDPSSTLFRNPRMAELLEAVPFRQGFGFGIDPDDLVFFSWPTHYGDVVRRLSADTDLGRVIHIVQNTRHSNPDWVGGYAYRLLSVPITRIMITRQVEEATRDLLSPDSLTRLIVEGHDWRYFHKRRSGGLGTPVRVGYTTWKSTVGDRVAVALSEDTRFEFRSITGEADWASIRDLYHWCDVFLACPGPQEGMYLPGLEAFAAGAILLTPDVEGNLAYCVLGENCVEVGFEADQDYVAALVDLVESDAATTDTMREKAYAVLPEFDLERERADFGRLIDDMS